MSTALPTVFLVDDDPPFLTATARLLRASGFQVEAFASAREFLASERRESPGCLVLDLQMPGMSGLELQETLQAAGASLPILFLTGNGDIPSSVQAMRAGAEDFLEKRAPKERLLAAIKRALLRDVGTRVIRAQQTGLAARFDGLSEREREVLGHVVRGRMNKQIARELGITERTVKAHRVAITTKLGVPSVAELTRLTLEAGLFPGAASGGQAES